MVATQETIEQVKEVASTYKYGFVTELESEKAPLRSHVKILLDLYLKRKKNLNGC